MIGRRISAMAVAVALLFALACERKTEGAPEGETQAVPEPMIAQPDTTAAGLWAHLTDANYRETWTMWPGKGRLYKGTEPHGMLLTTYLNPVALDALTNKAGTMPAGAIIVKENFAPDSTYAAATVMFKAPGYDAANNDWFWMKRNADGTVEAQGRVLMCAGCHAQKKDNDYVFTGALK